MKWHRTNSSRWIVVLPFDWLGILVVLTDIAHELASQILHRGEDPTCDDIALNAREPVLHLIEPGRISRRVVQPDIAMLTEEGTYQVRLVTTDVVADQVDFLLRPLTGDNVSQERDELLAGMAWCGLADYLPVCRIECGKQAERAVALVFKAMTLGAPRRQRQHPVLAIQGLNGGLLVHAEHHCMRWRVQIQPNHVRSLDLEVRIVGDHVLVQSVRTHAVLAPDALHGRDGHIPQFRRELVATPMRGSIRRLAFERVAQHARFEFLGRLQRRSSRVARVQAGKSLGQKTTRPSRDEARIATKSLHDRLARCALVKQQDQPRSTRICRTYGAAPSRRLQLFTLRLGQVHLFHAPNSITNGCFFNDAVD
ncbi:protein of unknown function (plasmid) [Cupriavidus taiwanensis]|uniref:Uncharacterized protein n=1 Tax=Cupriavidus taiwanensis TaxID=164546 RepID=A0A375IVT1_9BURK|nr:protein of unknown function [Cupriavidus taiwanensis]